jgi:Icc-related predicted phosphoesterase
MANPLRILAFSDHHGRYSRLAQRLVAESRPDWIILAGDMLPDCETYGFSVNRLRAQQDHWDRVKPCFLREGAVTTYILGNHEHEEFIDRDLLRRVPTILNGRVAFLEGVPTGPSASGFHPGYDQELMEEEYARAGRPPIILSHCPPYGLLRSDRVARSPGLRLVVCGHVHDDRGRMDVDGTLVVNVSDGYALLQLELPSLQPRVLDMDSMTGFKGRLELDED